MTAIVVLYEDSRPAQGNFGPHDFFLACVADDRGSSLYALKRQALANPLNGVDKLLQTLQDLDSVNRLGPGGCPILAIVDADKVREHLDSPANTTAEAIASQIRNDSSDPLRVTVVLLERNLESVVEAMRDCKEPALTLIAGALRKNLNDRDHLFESVGRDPGRRGIRDCVRKKVPSVEQVVKALASAIP